MKNRDHRKKNKKNPEINLVNGDITYRHLRTQEDKAEQTSTQHR